MGALDIITRMGETGSTTRPTSSADSGGAPKLTYAANVTAVKVFVQDKSGEENVRYGGEFSRRFAVVYAEPGVDILEKDRLVVGSRTFDITAVRTRGSTQPLQHMVLECQETERTP